MFMQNPFHLRAGNVKKINNVMREAMQPFKAKQLVFSITAFLKKKTTHINDTSPQGSSQRALCCS